MRVDAICKFNIIAEEFDSSKQILIELDSENVQASLAVFEKSAAFSNDNAAVATFTPNTKTSKKIRKA